ncbi:hypothetical protein MUP77_11510 [Candidatus Bathyarchaeota archaeon]|nr:hypothetical protein [Candidatus Bathyarchaeota archaeon]
MLTHAEVVTILESLGYVIAKKGRKEKKIPVGILQGKYAPNFDSVGAQNGYLVNIEAVNPSRFSRGGHAATDSSLKLGRIDKFYQLCKDITSTKSLLLFLEYARDSSYETMRTSGPELGQIEAL